MRADGAWAGRVGLHQFVADALEPAVLLLDREDPAVPVDDEEIDLAVDGSVLVGARPVNAVEDGQVVRELALEDLEGVESVAGRTAGADGVEFVGDEAGHGVGDRERFVE